MRSSREELPKGIHRARKLPDSSLGDLWDSIFVDGALKSQLVSQAVVNFTVRPKVSRSVLPLHGAMLLVGPPGTGKTSLARGLAHRTAEALRGASFKLLEIDPHTLTSSMMGRTQKAVSELFSQSIAEAAMAGPVIVLLDEIETMAVDRRKLSLEANPVDIHRATDAVLVRLDALAEEHHNLLFIATSNFPEAVDSAFTSRCDLVLEIPLPNKQACEQILAHCLKGLSATFKSIGKLPSESGFSKIVDEAVGLDGRAIRKAVGSALAMRPQVALKPDELTLADLHKAFTSAKATQLTKDKK